MTKEFIIFLKASRGSRQSHSPNNYFSTTGTSSTANNNFTTSTTARRQTKTQNTLHTTTITYASQRTDARRDSISNNF